MKKKSFSLSIAKDLRVESVGEVPEDVVTDILLKLPAKSLIRFRSVCKTWHDLIKSPSFIAEHFRENRKDLILLTGFGQNGSVLSSFSTESIVGGTYSNNSHYDLEIPSPDSRYTDYLLGPCNGIVCITDFRVSALCNPTLREFKVLPCPRFDLWTRNMGFGFDPMTDDYKVIRIAESICEDEDEDEDEYFSGPTIRAAEIYNLNSDSWRELDYPFSFACDSRVGILVEGACHWCSNETQDTIVSFHMSEEVFRLIGWGPIGEYRSYSRSLVVLDGCLGVVIDDDNSWMVIYEIWMMKEYGVESSWTKQFSYTIPYKVVNAISQYYFCLRKEGELLLKVTDQEIVSFNMRTKHVQTYFCAPVLDMMFDTNTSLIYKESLFSLNNPVTANSLATLESC